MQLRTGAARLRDRGALPARRGAWPEDAAAARRARRSSTPDRWSPTAQSYSWEIGQRERVDTGEEVDLKAWTQEQIVDEAQRAYLEVWNGRASLGRRVAGRARRVPRAEQLPGAHPRHPARRRDLPLGRAPRRHLAVAAGALERDLPPRPRRRCSPASPRRSAGPRRPRRSTRWSRSARSSTTSSPGTGSSDRPRRPSRRGSSACGGCAAPSPRRTTGAGSARDLERASRRPRPALRVVVDGDGGARREGARRPAATWSRRGAIALAGRRGASRVARRAALPPHGGGDRGAGLRPRCAMASDGPDRRSILVHHKNLDGPPLPRLRPRSRRGASRRRRDYNLLPGYREVPQDHGVASSPVAEWSVELPPTPDYQSHRTYVMPPIDDAGPLPGGRLGAARLRRRRPTSRVAVNLIVSDLVLLTRHRAKRASRSRCARARAAGAAGGRRSDLYRYDYRQRPPAWWPSRDHRRRRRGALRSADGGAGRTTSSSARRGRRGGADPERCGVHRRGRRPGSAPRR